MFGKKEDVDEEIKVQKVKEKAASAEKFPSKVLQTRGDEEVVSDLGGIELLDEVLNEQSTSVNVVKNSISEEGQPEVLVLNDIEDIPDGDIE